MCVLTNAPTSSQPPVIQQARKPSKQIQFTLFNQFVRTAKPLPCLHLPCDSFIHLPAVNVRANILICTFLWLWSLLALQLSDITMFRAHTHTHTQNSEIAKYDNGMHELCNIREWPRFHVWLACSVNRHTHTHSRIGGGSAVSSQTCPKHACAHTAEHIPIILTRRLFELYQVNDCARFPVYVLMINNNGFPHKIIIDWFPEY